MFSYRAKKGIGLAVSQKLVSVGYKVVVLDQEAITSNNDKVHTDNLMDLAKEV